MIAGYKTYQIPEQPKKNNSLGLDVETGGKRDQRKYENPSCASHEARYRFEDPRPDTAQQQWLHTGFKTRLKSLQFFQLLS